MKVIDELLLEWSYQCPDGIVDINNPEKVKILSRILNEIDSKQELVDLIKASDLSPEQIDKLKKYVSKKTTRSNVNVELENLLASKGLKRVGPLVIYLANKFDVEDILLEYLKTNKKSSIGENGNLFTEFSSESGLPEEFIKILTQTTSNQLGAGELLLVTMLNGAKKKIAKSGQGDVELGNGDILELKGKGATLSEWGSKKPIRNAFEEVYGESENLAQLTKNDNWLNKLIEDLRLKGDTEENKKAKEVLNKLYPNFQLDTNPDNLKNSIAENFIDQYFGSNINYILVLDETTGNYEKFNKENLKAALGSKIQCSFTKDTTPRIYLSNEKTKTDENITQ